MTPCDENNNINLSKCVLFDFNNLNKNIRYLYQNISCVSFREFQIMYNN